MLNLPVCHGRTGHDAGLEVSFKTGGIHNNTVKDYLNGRVITYPFNQGMHIFLDLSPVNGVVEFIQVAAKLLFLLQQKDIKALIRKTQSSCHAGRASSDDQGFFIYRKCLFLKRQHKAC